MGGNKLDRQDLVIEKESLPFTQSSGSRYVSYLIHIISFNL